MRCARLVQARPSAATALARKALAELIGSMLLAATVIGSGIAAQRLSPGDTLPAAAGERTGHRRGARRADPGARTVSAAFNPVVTLAEQALGAIDSVTATALIAAQVAGCCAGAVLANLMFAVDPVVLSTRKRGGGPLWLGEVVATFGLPVVIVGTVRSGRQAQVR